MFPLIIDPALHPYEEERLRQCMWNSARLKQLGIPALSSMFASSSAIAQDKNKRTRRNSEDYDDTSEGDLIDDDNAKQASKEKSGKKTSDMMCLLVESSFGLVERFAFMMKNAVRQQRHRLKQKYFDPLPLHLDRKTTPIKFMTNEQWINLVELWKSPKKMEACQTNKYNRGKATGSQSYMVFVENFLSTPTESEEPKSANQVVGDVLAENTKKNQFLQNIGIKNAQPTSTERNIEAELEAEKRSNAELRSLVNTQRAQLDELSQEVQETKQGRIRDREEMKKMQAEMNAKLELVLSQVRPN
uniref:Uncharacterized protein n=1 Tax=Setaria viridis TaxID=4556 RepID=A0A4U6TZ16_SETVI|nr:hypothetical protein SEVIR_6G018000v2 [Setaria viridis]